MNPGTEIHEGAIEIPKGGNPEVVAGALTRAGDDAVKKLEGSVNWGDFVGRMIVDLIPVVGGVAKVIEARDEFSQYAPTDHSLEAELARNRARRHCVIGMLETVLDVAGVTTFLPDEVLTALNRLKVLINARDRGSALGDKWAAVLEKVDLVGHLADLMMGIPRVESAVESALTTRNGRLEKFLEGLPDS